MAVALTLPTCWAIKAAADRNSRAQVGDGEVGREDLGPALGRAGGVEETEAAHDRQAGPEVPEDYHQDRGIGEPDGHHRQAKRGEHQAGGMARRRPASWPTAVAA